MHLSSQGKMCDAAEPFHIMHKPEKTIYVENMIYKHMRKGK